jgi:MFS family permease
MPPSWLRIWSSPSTIKRAEQPQKLAPAARISGGSVRSEIDMSISDLNAPYTPRLDLLPDLPRGTFVVLAATLTMAMGFGGLSLISVFMAPMEAEFGWSRTDTSLAYAFATAGMAVGGFGWGRLADRADIRVLLSIGATGMVAALLAMAMLRSLPLFYLASLVYGGFGFSMLYSPLMSTSGEWFPRRRGLVTGIVTAGGALGQGVLPFIANLLIQGFGWRLAFAGIGCVTLAALALSLPAVRWPQGTKAPLAAAKGPRDADEGQSKQIALLALAAFLCCACMGMPLVHLTSFVGAICASPSIGVSALLIAMISGAIGRVCFGIAADRIGALTSYAIASAIQTICLPVFPELGDSLSLMTLSAVFGFGFAGNMTCLALCIRKAVPANRFGGALGAVMMVAWAGMACGGYVGGLLFDATLSYKLSFLLATAAGALNLMVLAVLARHRTASPRLRLSQPLGLGAGSS